MTVETTDQVELSTENAENQDDSAHSSDQAGTEIDLDAILAPIEAMLVSTDRPLKAIALVE